MGGIVCAGIYTYTATAASLPVHLHRIQRFLEADGDTGFAGQTGAAGSAPLSFRPGFFKRKTFLEPLEVHSFLRRYPYHLDFRLVAFSQRKTVALIISLPALPHIQPSEVSLY